MANPVEVSDIAARWRPLSAEETAVANALLADAWAIVLTEVPSVEPRLAADPPTLDVALLRSVMSAMVLRVLRNPEGKLSEQIDDYKFTLDKSRATGSLHLTPEEAALLAPPGASTGAFTIRPSYAPDDLATMTAWWAARQ